MLVYRISWTLNPNLTKGKGRPVNVRTHFLFTVLCRNSRDAASCLEWYFANIYEGSSKYTLDDGVIEFTRASLDSRSFDVNYLQMDGIPQPLALSDVKRSLDHFILKSCKVY